MAEVAKTRRGAPRSRGTMLSSHRSGYVHVSPCSAVTVCPSEVESKLLWVGVQAVLTLLLSCLGRENLFLLFSHLFGVPVL